MSNSNNITTTASRFSLSDGKTRGVVYQTLTIALIIWFVWWIVDNTIINMRERNMASGFGFLTETAGFGISQALIPYSEESSYGRVFLVGILNTLIIGIIGCILTTILGFIVGVARLSKNWVVNKVATVYVEVLRNIPLLLQIFFWYHAVLKPLKGPREVHNDGDLIWFSLTNSGLMMPKPLPEKSFLFVLAAFIIGLIVAIIIKKMAKKKQMKTGKITKTMVPSLFLIVVLPILVYYIIDVFNGSPLGWQAGVMSRFRPLDGYGMLLLPEFMAVLIALVVYTSAFIAEIVRSGIASVNHGQTEAAFALGVKPSRTLRLIIIPQSMRVIVPPLTSQYLNLIKNSSLGAAIGYPELNAVFAGTALSQSGRAIEVMLLTMSVYCFISLLISVFMNWYNRSIKLVER